MPAMEIPSAEDISTFDNDLMQSLDLTNWLSDLCEIKDAFGTEAYVGIAYGQR